MTTHCERIKTHYAAAWRNQPTMRRWQEGPAHELPESFCVLEFAPTAARTMWTYATCCMSQPQDDELVEIHMFSPNQCNLHVELLTAIGHYHRTGARLGLGHTVNFGRPWIEGSNCDHGLVSLPYLDGPALERAECPDLQRVITCLWLIPITKQEREYKRVHGLAALERRFEDANFDYLDAFRPSVA